MKYLLLGIILFSMGLAETVIIFSPIYTIKHENVRVRRCRRLEIVFEDEEKVTAYVGFPYAIVKDIEWDN